MEGNPGALPRLRGRGEQGDIAKHILTRSVPYQFRLSNGPSITASHRSAVADGMSGGRVKSASQARQRSKSYRLPPLLRLFAAIFFAAILDREPSHYPHLHGQRHRPTRSHHSGMGRLV